MHCSEPKGENRQLYLCFLSIILYSKTLCTCPPLSAFITLLQSLFYVEYPVPCNERIKFAGISLYRLLFVGNFYPCLGVWRIDLFSCEIDEEISLLWTCIYLRGLHSYSSDLSTTLDSCPLSKEVEGKFLTVCNRVILSGEAESVITRMEFGRMWRIVSRDIDPNRYDKKVMQR